MQTVGSTCARSAESFDSSGKSKKDGELRLVGEHIC